MTNTSEPNNNAARLNALHEHGLMDTLPEPVFDEIVRRVAAICETPIALLSLIDDRRQWFKARVGFPLPELPLGIGFDPVTLLQPLVVRDATEDPRFSCDPLVVSELNIRFYAGVPIATDDGYPIGVLSIMDYSARELTPHQQKALAEQAQQAEIQLSLRRKLLASTQPTVEHEPVTIVPSKRDPNAEPRVILPDVMMRFGRDFRYSYVSPFAIEAIGVRPDALLGREVGAERVPVAFADSLRAALERSIQNRRIEEIEFLYMSPSGERLFQTRLMPEISGGEVHAILSITREVVHEEPPASDPIPTRPALRALLGIAIAESSTIPELLQRCSEALATFSGAPLVRIWLRDAENHSLQLRANAGDAASLISGDPGHTVLDIPADANTLDALAARAFGFDAEEAAARELAETSAFPLKTGGLLIGIIALRDRLAPPDEVRDEILEATGTVAMAVRRNQESDALTEQATSLAKDLLDARLALQREAESSASLAHELRTPLNSVLGLTNLLLGTELEPAQRELGEMTRSSARALLHLVNDTLDGPKSEGGDLTLEAAPFNMREVIEDVGAMLAGKAQGKGIDLIVRCSPDMPEWTIGDAGRIRQILTNLVDNAIKFTREGFVLVDSGSDVVIDGEARISVEVEDTGIGITAALQEAVFDRYVQAGTIPDSQETGSGLGLAISREFAERMGGTIELRSRAGEGSIFRFTLRLPVDVGAIVEPTAESISGLRALVVDGPQLQQYAMRELLNYWEVRVDRCASVGEMLDAMRDAVANGDPYQAVLLDERVVGSDGRAIISAVLTTDEFQQARLVILTSVGRNRDVERMVAEGFAAALTKPLRRRPLLEAISKIALELPPRRPAVSGPVGHVEQPIEEQPGQPVESAPTENAKSDEATAPAEAEQPPVEQPASTVEPETPAEDETAGPADTDLNETERRPAPVTGGGAEEPVVVDQVSAPVDVLDAEPIDVSRAVAEVPSIEEKPAASIAKPVASAPAVRAKSQAKPRRKAAVTAAPVKEAVTPPPEVDQPDGHPTTAQQDVRDHTYALVVEDDTVNQRVAKMMLEKMGCVVDVASSGNEAIALFETRVYDLVLIDCKMSGMDGYETTEVLRRMEAGDRHTPIIAVTADTSAGARERCLGAGMDGYITKPVRSEELQYEIERLLDSTLPPRDAPPSAPLDEVLDRRALLARVAGNTDVLRSLANLCEAECAKLMAEIRDAIATGDRSQFLRATHKLRGNIMSMEARAAVEAVRRLELTANQGRPADAEELLDPLQNELERLLTTMNAILDETDAVL